MGDIVDLLATILVGSLVLIAVALIGGDIYSMRNLQRAIDAECKLMCHGSTVTHCGELRRIAVCGNGTAFDLNKRERIGR